ncbi:uncharacterized protein LOC129810355 [Phlebotomus papatasi]|uniref:uncharacterized protein LOC129810355 n=1 Tax=Phlebotomus papatasi TaxID=29031 RepID=UPI002483CE84|nr:uncharacterized protein LOC129810355 [Phlebotomus papatasi]
MTEKVLIYVFLLATVLVATNGLTCYTCDSDEDPGCLDNPEDQRAFLCRIMNVGEESFRCMTITAIKGEQRIAVRRCAMDGECQVQLAVDNSFDWGGEIFPDAQCSVCATDYCNTQ